jgi:hypothetical protein
MNKVFLSSLAVTALCSAISAPASAQTQTAFVKDPISVEGFSASSPYSAASTRWFDGVNATGESIDVTISFVNTASQPAKSVEFAVRSGGHTCLIVDKGTFSPGTRITHTFSQSPQLEDASSVQIRKVTFADGSSWES